MPWPLSRLDGLKLMPMSDSFYRIRGRAALQFCLFPKVLRDPAGHTQYFGTRHLQDHSPRCLDRVLDNHLVPNLAVMLHLDDILRKLGLCRDLLDMLGF